MMPARNDLAIYERHGDAWWDCADRTFASLRSIATFRMALLKEWLGDVRGRSIADFGCGGGLMARPMALRGARVIGVDLSQRSLVCARRHAGPRSAFVRSDIHRVPLATRSVDSVLIADVLEHVAEPMHVLREAARVVRETGVVYVNTINRTLWSRLLAVTFAESVGLIPRGTHDPAMFVRPEEIDDCLVERGFTRERVQGEGVNIAATLASRSIVLRRLCSTAIGYSVLYRRKLVA